jgi:hypothetical protein
MFTSSSFAVRAACLCTLALGLVVARTQRAHDIPAGETKSAADIARAADEMATAANALIETLTDEQKAKMLFDFKDAEREKFIFVPHERKGLPLREMTPFQRPFAFALLGTGMSSHGYYGVMSIMSLEEILRAAEVGKNGPKRDPEGYFVEIFGKPGNDQIWAWRFEGHHFSASFTVVMGKTIIAAPLFMGSNPERVLDGPRKGHATLAETEVLGRTLVNALTDEQRKKAIIMPDAPKDIFTGTDRHAKLETQGLAAAEFNAGQKAALMNIIGEFASRDRAEVAAADLAKIEKEGVDKIVFAWAGSTEPNHAHYYRIHGPTFIIEYDNIQNNANHIHSVWRDLQNDFGEDVLRKHYAETPH